MVYFQYFINYANLARGNFDGSPENRLLQLLWFLIRDWSSPDEHEYGMKGGDEVLQELMEAGVTLIVLLSEYRPSYIEHAKNLLYHALYVTG